MIVTKSPPSFQPLNISFKIENEKDLKTFMVLLSLAHRVFSVLPHEMVVLPTGEAIHINDHVKQINEFTKRVLGIDDSDETWQLLGESLSK